MNKNQYGIILAGSVESKLWPISVNAQPKQFTDVLGLGRTLIQQTYDRLSHVCPANHIYVVTNQLHLHLAAKQLPQVPPENFVIEPCYKNTAPGIAYATYKIQQKNPDAVIVVSPSDHLITQLSTFITAIKSCVKIAQSADCLISIGNKPSHKSSGSGCITYTNTRDGISSGRILKVNTFIENPDDEQLKLFENSYGFVYNTGIFICSVKSMCNALEKNDAEFASVFKKGISVYDTVEEKEFITKAYQISKNISIEQVVFEKADNVYVRSSLLGWSNLSTWNNLSLHIKLESGNNAILGKNVMQYDCKDCIVHVPDNKLVVVHGLTGYMVLESNGTLVICKKEDEHKINHFVHDVKKIKGDKYI